MAKLDVADLRAAAHAAAAEWADDPATVVELPHAGFNTDPVSGGVAFLCDRGLVIFDVDGSKGWSVDPGDSAGRVAQIRRAWDAARHRNRALPLDELGPWQRAAVAAFMRDARSVGDLDPGVRPGVDGVDIARSDLVLVHLRRHAKERSEAAALRVFAGNDWLLAPPSEHERPHACPVCGGPALGGRRYATAVCDTCKPKTVCSHGKPVTGHNVSFSGGFAAVHADDDSPCDQVTDDGRCWIDGHACHMGEARFGGVVVRSVRPAAG